MIGVVVPVHNEEACLEACLLALHVAALHPALNGEPVMLVVVLDDCTDDSLAIAQRHAAAQVTCLTMASRNVGIARHLGAQHLLARKARWLAFTDADSRVAPDWLVAQLALCADAVCGLVTVDDWSQQPAHVPARFDARYCRKDGHRHIHGANFGICARTYRRAGGFPPHAISEDVALVQRLIALNAQIAWSTQPRVMTSARATARAPGGFADYLAMLAALSADVPPA
ncbi:glycosyltransferase [Cupriavidus pinatubonensis]|uniref:glycosyltransferase n=1 Tax=Cupriavidus pinatubonensis TaxID=248026 RepID=UPI00112EB86A|nr:glycosyltransferase [Cupriavidus pinatubonensis]QYY28045.1 glycosyltransferase [Cupriavidus pinatubonensis]TPQ30403.1 glycosyl transferase [Cupriavidus pinatubonensis]